MLMSPPQIPRRSHVSQHRSSRPRVANLFQLDTRTFARLYDRSHLVVVPSPAGFDSKNEPL